MIRRRLAGLVALLLILGLIIGLPLLLIALGANPAEWHIPTLTEVRDTLTSPDDGTLLLLLVQVVAWIAWAFLTLSILIETAAAARGIRAPRLPVVRISQGAARGLVGTAALLFISVPIGAANAAPAAAAAPPAATAPAVDNPPASSLSQQATSAPAPHSDASKPSTRKAPRTTEHTVEPGESLWSIADHHLGDGRRFHEIVELNPDVLHGRADFLRPGWTLRLPVDHQRAAFRTVVVDEGDTLSSIAHRELGDPDRFEEIFEASRHLPQPGGAHLTDPNVIDIGWTLRIPTHTRQTNPPHAEHDPAASPATEHRPVHQKPSQLPESSHTERPGAAPAPQPPPATEPPAATVTPTPEASPQVPEPSVAQPELSTASAAEHLTEESAWSARTVSGVGAVLAAGVLALVATRRRNQQRRRRPGQRMPMPSGRTAEVEQELQAVSDPLAIETVDAALRGLAQHCADAGQPLPAVRAGRLTAAAFDLYLTGASQLPAPWTDIADGTVWTLDVDRALDIDLEQFADIPAPYPALVTIGHDDEEGHVLLDLETLGALAITGDPAATREILAALAIELATSAWADDLQITVVGMGAELEDTLQTGRIRYLPSIGRALDDLHRRATEDREAFAAAGSPDLHAARATGAAADAWSPEILLIAGELPDRQRTLLTQLVTDIPRVAIAAVTAGDDAVGEWALDLNAGDTEDVAVLKPIGLQLRPQRVPAEQYGHLLEIAALTDPDELLGEPRPEPTLDQIQAIPPVDEQPKSDATMPEVTLEALEANVPVSEPATDVPIDHDPSAQALADTEPVPPGPTAAASAPTNGEAHVQPIPLPPPRILILGPVQILNAGGPVEPTKRARLLEYAAYLALNPGATHTAIDDAIWPDRAREDNLSTRNPATSKLRRWVGKTPDGADYLPTHQAGTGYGFVAEVSTDLDDWEHLLRRDPFNAATGDLEAALALVRGAPFEGAHRSRYGWAQPLRQRLIGEVVDTSYELGRRRLMEGRWRAAEQALVVGLRLEPAQESLWRLRILAAHESRNVAAEAEAIDRLLAIIEALDCGLEPETEQLLQALKSPGTDFGKLIATAL